MGQHQNVWFPTTGQTRIDQEDYTKVSNLYINKGIPPSPLSTTSEIPLFLKSLIEGIQTTSYAKADDQPAERQTHLTNGENACSIETQWTGRWKFGTNGGSSEHFYRRLNASKSARIERREDSKTHSVAKI